MTINIYYSLVFSIVVYAVAYLLVPLNIRFSKIVDLIDYPSSESIHKSATPLAGGLAISIPIITLLTLGHFLLTGLQDYPSLAPLIIGSAGIVVAGYFDDKYRLSALWKLLFQLIIAIFMYQCGYKITLLTNPWNDAITLGYLSFPATIGWYLLLINSINLIDGIDGLATGIAVIISFVLMIVGYRYDNPFIFYLSLFLFASSLAFLKYNFPPAKIFLGDTGSQFIGFYLAAISIAGTAQYKGITAMTLLIPIIVMFIPLADTFLAIVRRLKYRQGIFTRDNHHLHHKMLKMGFSTKAINYTCYFITFLFGLIAIGFSFADKSLLFTILICLAVILFFILYFVAKKGLMK